MKHARWVASAAALAVVSGGAVAGYSLRGTLADTPDTRGSGRHDQKAAATNTVVKPVSFVGSEPGKAIPLPGGPAGPAPDPARAARAHLKKYGAKFGIRDAQRQLRTAKTVKAERGQSIVRFQQVQDGIPVLGGELTVALDRRGALLSLNGETSRSAVLRRPARITAEEARSVALSDTAQRAKRAAGSLVATTPQAWMFDPSLLGAPGLPVARKVWKVEVTLRAGSAVRQFVLVDAADGRVVLSFNQRAHAKAQVICDAGNVSRPGDPACDGVTLPYAYKPGDAPPASGEARQAYDTMNAAYDFYLGKLGVDLTDLIGYDAGDGLGKVLRSTIQHCVDGETCPYDNAYWNSGIEGGRWRGQVFFGAGFAGADDVVAHELSHGVTERTSALMYYAQAGAINESLSDVFGELADLSDGIGTDGDGQRWQLGEDLPPSVGVIRDMADPTRYQQPDRMTSSLWQSFWDDNGGVHQNSGVGNKAAYLITDGGTFNSTTVTGLGIDKTAKIYYRVEQLLTSGADYAQLYRVLPQACKDLVDTATASGPIAAEDCAQVQAAVDATEMNRVPAGEPAPASSPVCQPGQARGDVGFDDFEPGTSPRGFTWAGSNPAWTEVDDYTQPVPGEQGGYQLFGPDPVAGPPDFSKAMATGVRLPAGVKAYARFDHAYAFDWQDPAPPTPEAQRVFWDGGFVEVSVDNGAWKPAAFANNGPTKPIDAANGQVGFGGDSLGWLSSRVDLSPYAGHVVKLRFRIVSDGQAPYSAGIGWFVDNLRIYGCGPTTPGAATAVTAVGGAGQATVRWAAPAWIGSGPITGYQVRAYPDGPAVTVPAAARSAVLSGLRSGTSYSFGVRPVNAAGVGPEVRTAVLKGTLLSVNVPPAAVTFGAGLALSGKLTYGGSTAPVRGALVLVQERRKGGTAWTKVGSTRTTPTGTWAMTVKPAFNADYRAAYSPGSATLLGAISPTRTVAVRLAVTAAASNTAPRAGATVRIRGAAKPVRPGLKVQLQRQTASGWVTINSTTLSSTGTYAFSRVYTRGTWKLRAVVVGDVRNATGASPVVTLRVT